MTKITSPNSKKSDLLPLRRFFFFKKSWRIGSTILEFGLTTFMNAKLQIFKNINAGLVVFFVALPLCLGIAVASGASPVSGLVSGIIGGIVVGLLSGSQVSVSGPAAGLTVVVLDTLVKLGEFEALLASIVTMGFFQIVLGFARAGFISSIFPTSVIKGMLSGIGAVLVLKQLPHAVGWDQSFEGDFSFFQPTGEYSNTFSTLMHIWSHIDIKALSVFLAALLVLLVWDSKKINLGMIKKFIPSQFIAVMIGTLIATYCFEFYETHNLIQIPTSLKPTMLDWNSFSNPSVYFCGFVLALIGSLETLLSVDAADKIDPLKRTSNMNRELFAQGVGNIACGFLGGIPVTSVVVRTTTAIQAGATNRISAISHGILLLLSVLLIPRLLNYIPLSALAGILILVGYKLCSLKVIKGMWNQGWNQFLPYAVTLLAVVFTDLLTGVGLGLAIGSIFILYQNTKSTTTLVSESNDYLLRINRDMTFLNKRELKSALTSIPANASLIIESRRPHYLDQDIREIFRDFQDLAIEKKIRIEIHGIWAEGVFKGAPDGKV